MNNHVFSVGLKDSLFGHASSVGNGDLGIRPKYLYFDRSDEPHPITFFTDLDVARVDEDTSAIKVAWLLESPEMHEKIYTKFKDPEFYNKFDLILTFRRELLELDEKFVFSPFGGCWIQPEDQKIHPKKQNVSIVASAKKDQVGHKLRHEVVSSFGKNLDGIFGRGYQPLDDKLDGLKDFRYSVVIENCKDDYWFTEKLIDCFATGTIPIYWGCPSIGKFFDTDGILQFDTIEEFEAILKKLSAKDYNSRQDAIKRNFETAKLFTVTEDYIYQKIVKDHPLFKEALRRTSMNPKLKIYPVDEVSYKNLSPQEAHVLPWVAAKGDDSLRLDYPLDKDSLVYDIGGYVGDWARDINNKYGSRIKVFEPVDQYVTILEKLFKNNKSIAIFPYGLGGQTRKETIGIDGLASSVFKPGENTLEIEIRDISQEMGDDKVDLMKMNIEGGEYELLDKIIETGQVRNVRNIQIQFHDFVPDAKNKRQRLQEQLSKTHSLTYNYPFIWENWERNE